MRHTFVSVLSASGVPVESIALLAGHDRTATTESVYRHEIRPALTQGAEVMDKIFGASSDMTSEAVQFTVVGCIPPRYSPLPPG